EITVATGPVWLALPTTNCGCWSLVVTLLMGAVSVGAPNTTGVKMLNALVAPNGPVLAPSSARACQKYFRSGVNGPGSVMLVRPLPSCGTPSFAYTGTVKFGSVAISKR